MIFIDKNQWLVIGTDVLVFVLFWLRGYKPSRATILLARKHSWGSRMPLANSKIGKS
jgi:hypothetical protein